MVRLPAIFYSKRTLLSSLTGVGETEPRTVHEVYSNGLALPAASVKYNNSHYTSDFDTSLHITNISFSDAGTYSCSLETDIKSFELYVIGKFSFIHIILSLCHWIWMYYIIFLIYSHTQVNNESLKKGIQMKIGPQYLCLL